MVLKYNCEERSELIRNDLVSIRNDIFCNFVWDETSEGFDHWFNVYKKLTDLINEIEELMR